MVLEPVGWESEPGFFVANFIGELVKDLSIWPIYRRTGRSVVAHFDFGRFWDCAFWVLTATANLK